MRGGKEREGGLFLLVVPEIDDVQFDCWAPFTMSKTNRKKGWAETQKGHSQVHTLYHCAYALALTA